jgi:hypothetical protein
VNGSTLPRGRNRTKVAKDGYVPAVKAFPDEFFRRPVTALFISPSPALLGPTVYGVAAAVDPGVTWTDVRLPGEKPVATDPGVLGLVRPDRYHTVDPETMRPSERASSVNATGLIDSAEPASFVDQLKAFLELSSHTQEMLAETVAGRRPPVLVLNNAQRINQFYPAPLTVRVLEVFKRLGVTLFLGYVGDPPSNRSVFDYVFRIDAGELSAWAQVNLTCEKGTVVGPLAGGRACPLGELAPIARAFEKAQKRAI